MSSVVFTEVYSRYQAPQLTDEQVRDLNARARIRIAAENAEKNRKKQEKKLAKANKKGKADLVAHRFGLLDLHGAETVPEEKESNPIPEPRSQGLLSASSSIYDEDRPEEEDDEIDEPRRNLAYTPPRQNSYTKEIRLGNFDEDEDDDEDTFPPMVSSPVAARQGSVTKEIRLGSVDESTVATPATKEIRLGSISADEPVPAAGSLKQRGKSVSFSGAKEGGDVSGKKAERRGSVLKFLRRGSKSKIDGS
ncbi:MAG: hypothetical protein MMC33_005887 [Icmadophila ericetorum]|nr:hypothetical protein [Icmadophila ericetorum]